MMAWDDTQTSGDCITPTEWNNMVTYIKTLGSACTNTSEATFTLYSDCEGKTGEKFKFDFLGDDSLLYGAAVTGYDLFIYANSIDDCSSIELYGNSGISNKIKVGSVFDVSSCSGETFFEMDTSSPTMHFNFHCFESYEFRLENRIADPSGPTCVGRIWFRIDL